MNNLQMGDKEYQAINHNKGWIWVSELDVSKGDFYYDESTGDILNASTIKPRVIAVHSKAVAQTPEAGIKGLPCIDIEGMIKNSARNNQTFNKAARIEVSTSTQDDLYQGYLDGYKAGQQNSMNLFTFDQIRRAVERALKENNPDKIWEIIQSVRTKIVVDSRRHDCFDPATYTRDGKTYFYFKIVNPIYREG